MTIYRSLLVSNGHYEYATPLELSIINKGKRKMIFK